MPLRLRISVVLAAALLLDQAHCRAEDPPTSPPNILLLLVDDLLSRLSERTLLLLKTLVATPSP